MRNHIFGLAIVLASSLGISGCNSEPQAATPTPLPETQPPPPEYQLQLPSLADVQLSDRSLKTGNVIQVRDDAIVMEGDGVPEEIAIANVRKVMFKGDESLPSVSGPSAIRGTEIWSIFADRVRFDDRALTVKQEDITLSDGEFPSESICHVKSMWFKQENDTVQLNLRVSHCEP